MTDSTDKKSKETRDQDNQHQSLHQRLNSIDKKVKEKSNNLDVDLDAMLDEAEFSFAPNDEFQDEEDALERLLMNTGFDEDDALMQTQMNKDIHTVKDVRQRDELDDFLNFDGFESDFDEPETAQADVAGLEQTLRKPTFTPHDAQDDEDDLDRLVMNVALDADQIPRQALAEDVEPLEALDDFSDFSGFDEPEVVSAVEADETEPENSSADDAESPDELDEFLSSIDDFDESDMLQDDDVDVEASIPAESELVAPLADEKSGEDQDADELDELDKFSDFSDFNEPDMGPVPEVVEPDQADEMLSFNADDADLSDEADDFSGLEGFDESDLIQGDEDEAPIPVAVDSDVSTDVKTLGTEKDVDVDVVEELDDFSDFSDFNKPDIVSPVETEEAEQIADNSSSSANEETQPEEVDEFSDFDGFGDGFDESDSLQDDQVEASADLVATDKQQSAAVQESVDVQDADDSFNSLFADAVFDAEDNLEQADDKRDTLVEDAGLSDEVDDFSGLVDDFSDSDLIQDDEMEASEDLLASYEKQSAAVEESADEQDADDSFNSLFADADFGEEDALEQAEGEIDQVGDDASLSEIDDFFQLSEDTDDFSKQMMEAQLTESEKPSTQDEQEDDFLLPDFDITADTEASGADADKKNNENEFLDAFGDTDFLNENEAMQTLETEISEQKIGDNEAVAASKSTAIEDAENVRLNPFEFEQEDLKKQLDDAENKVKKAKRYSYLAIGFGAVALSAAAGLGVMTYMAKTEVSKLTEAVSTLEANLARSAANSPSEEVDAMRNSIGLLNKQVDGFITELKGNSQLPVDLLDNKVPDIVAKQDMVSKALDMLQVKVSDLEGKVSSASSVVEPLNLELTPTPAPVNEDVQEAAPLKAAPEHESVQVKHEPAPAKKESVHEQAPTKERAVHETDAAKLKPQPEVVTAKPVIPEKPVVVEKPVVEEKPAKINKPVVMGKWGINLVAFKQEWFAKSKAAEFASMGVFAEVIPVHEKNTTMYRLRVGGFRSKAEANSNTAKIKQALNLDSVWVSDN